MGGDVGDGFGRGRVRELDGDEGYGVGPPGEVLEVRSLM